MAPPPIVAAAPAPPALKAGALVVVVVTEPISTRTVKRGDFFGIKVLTPVVADGRVVIPAGVTGVGQVVDAGKPGIGGKPAKLVLAARRLDLPNQQAPLRGFHLAQTGVDTSDAAMAVSMIPYVGIAGIFIKGGHVEIPAGTLATAKLSTDFTPAVAAAPAASPPSAPQTPTQGPSS